MNLSPSLESNPQFEQIRNVGNDEMLNRIIGSLEATHYRDGELKSYQGGDIYVMKEVERLCKEAIEYWTK